MLWYGLSGHWLSVICRGRTHFCNQITYTYGRSSSVSSEDLTLQVQVLINFTGVENINFNRLWQRQCVSSNYLLCFSDKSVVKKMWQGLCSIVAFFPLICIFNSSLIIYIPSRLRLETGKRCHKSWPWIQFKILTHQDCDVPSLRDCKMHPAYQLLLEEAATPDSSSINMGLTKLIRLWGILKYPPSPKKKNLFIKWGNIMVIYDLFKPLERLTEDITRAVNQTDCSHGNTTPCTQ